MILQEEDEETKSFTCSSAIQNTRNNKKKKIMRRFSDEQIKALEKIFESDSKLEPSQKSKLARELGLQTRQVAIWFQNRRARWKSKVVEKDYSMLQGDYASLVDRFEALKKENQALTSQIRKLNDMLLTPKAEARCYNQSLEKNYDKSESSYNEDHIADGQCESEVIPIFSMERLETEFDKDTETSIKLEYFDSDVTMMTEQGDCSWTTSSDKWCNSFDTDGMFDDTTTTTSNATWWDFWS